MRTPFEWGNFKGSWDRVSPSGRSAATSPVRGRMGAGRAPGSSPCQGEAGGGTVPAPGLRNGGLFFDGVGGEA